MKNLCDLEVGDKIFIWDYDRRQSLIGEITELLTSSNNTVHIRYKEIIGNSHFINNMLAFSMELLRGRKRLYINSFYGH